MAKNNNVAHAIAMFIIVGAIICCSSIAKFHCETTTSPKGSWTTYYYIASNIEDCIKECRVHISRSRLIKRRECIKQCIVKECKRRHPFHKQKRFACYDYLRALFAKKES
ncbi:hypothetical protein PIB30_083925 [Stylosanthes scabra]|uniref:Uncharacterized protein n=1 Tax=Stylosanthes scabra TaxID=79078 RepID=A0ABU6QSG3_9FABA|nr:hypothetical protein [Stylosanthes scabra]